MITPHNHLRLLLKNLLNFNNNSLDEMTTISFNKGDFCVDGFEVEKAIIFCDKDGKEKKWMWQIWTTAFYFGGRSLYKDRNSAINAMYLSLFINGNQMDNDDGE